MTEHIETEIADKIAYPRESIWFMRDFDRIARDMGFIKTETCTCNEKNHSPRCGYVQ